MIGVSSSKEGGIKTLSNSADDCCKLGTEPNCSKPYHKFRVPAFFNGMKFSVTFYVGRIGEKRIPTLRHFWALLMPDSSPAFLPWWSISKSLLGDRLWSLKRHWLWPQYKGMCHLLQLSLHADNSRYSSC